MFVIERDIPLPIGEIYYFRELTYFNADMSKWNIDDFYEVNPLYEKLSFVLSNVNTPMVFSHTNSLN